MNRDRHQQQKRSGIQLGTKTLLEFPSNVATAHRTIAAPVSSFSPQARRARAVASRQRRLTDSMVLEEASDTYLRAFSEQVTRLKRLTDGLQRFDTSAPSDASESRQNNNSMVDNGQNSTALLETEYGPGEGDGRRSNWRALSSSLASGYRFRSASTSAAVDRQRLVPPGTASSVLHSKNF